MGSLRQGDQATEVPQQTFGYHQDNKASVDHRSSQDVRANIVSQTSEALLEHGRRHVELLEQFSDPQPLLTVNIKTSYARHQLNSLKPKSRSEVPIRPKSIRVRTRGEKNLVWIFTGLMLPVLIAAALSSPMTLLQTLWRTSIILLVFKTAIDIVLPHRSSLRRILLIPLLVGLFVGCRMLATTVYVAWDIFQMIVDVVHNLASENGSDKEKERQFGSAGVAND